LNKAITANEGLKANCKKMCDPNLTNTPPSQPVPRAEEQGKIIQAGKECQSGIDQVEQQEKQALGANQTANPKAGDTTKNSGGDPKASNPDSSKPASSSPPPSIPPISPPPAAADTKPTTPTTPTDTAQPASTPPAAPAAPAATPPATGTAGFKTAAAASPTVAAACTGQPNIPGCSAVSSPATSTVAASTFPGGSGGSGSGGGGSSAMGVASVPVGLGKDTGSGKDGSNSGIKAASMNMSTDGGGGGGGSGGGGLGSLSDLDFNFKKPGARGPASAGTKSTLAAASASSQIAPQSFSVTKIVTEIYADRCKAGRFLHCGNNK